MESYPSVKVEKKVGLIEGKVISFLVKLSWLLQNCIYGQNCICVHKQISYQPIMQITRGTEKIKVMVLVKKAVQQVVA